MSRRTDIVAQLRADLSTIATSSSILKTIDEINDWPTICFTPGTESRQHFGGGLRWATTLIQLRGYTYDAGIDAMTAAEDLARSIEDVVDQFRASHPSLNVVQMRVSSIRTDEGVMEPYGIADLLIELTYEVT
jgi:hypothetical protein